MDFLDEVKQELSEENLTRLIKKYSPLVFGMMVAVIIGLVGGMWWKSYKADKIYHDGSQYVMAITKMKAYKPDDAMAIFESIANNNTPYGMLAGLNLASFKHYKKDYNESQKWYSEIESNHTASKAFADLAKLMKIKSMADNDANPKTSTELLEKYIKSDSTFKLTAQEMLASIYIKNNEMDKASHVLDQIVTELTAPNTIRERAAQMQVLVKN